MTLGYSIILGYILQCKLTKENGKTRKRSLTTDGLCSQEVGSNQAMMQPDNKAYEQGQPPAYSQPPAGAYQPQPAGAYQPQPAGAYQPQPAGAYQPGYGQPPATVVIAQPAPIGATVIGQRPPDYLIPSIFACLFCFWPTGLCAIIYAIKANSLVGQGDMAGADAAAKTAKILMLTSVGIGAIFILIMVILAATGSFVTYTYSRTY